MTQPDPYQPSSGPQPMPHQVPYPQPYYVQPIVQQSNTVGTAGFVLGLLGVIVVWLPVIGLVAWLFTILGLIFSWIGFNHARRTRTSTALPAAGLVFSTIGLGICVLWLVLIMVGIIAL